MKRRQAIQRTAYSISSLWALPSVISFIQGCGREIKAPDQLVVFSSQEFSLVSTLADTILPKTDSPSASEVQVPQFIDLLLQEVFEQPWQDQFMKGLNYFEQACEEAFGQSFLKLDAETRAEYVQIMDHQVFSENQEHSFYSTFKQLVIKIYFSTEQGVKQNLSYQPVPGPFQADVPLNSGDKVMLGNDM